MTKTKAQAALDRYKNDVENPFCMTEEEKDAYILAYNQGRADTLREVLEWARENVQEVTTMNGFYDAAVYFDDLKKFAGGEGVSS